MYRGILEGKEGYLEFEINIFFNFMPSLCSEVHLTYILIMAVFSGIFRAIDIELHSRDFHTATLALVL